MRTPVPRQLSNLDYHLSKGTTTRRIIQLSVAIVLLFGWLSLPEVISAQQQPEIDAESQAEYSFGQALRFSLKARAPSAIQMITLFLQAPEFVNTLTAEVEFAPDEEVDITHVVDLTQLRLAPFTTVTYWWSIEDEDGNSLTTEPQAIQYVDNQFEWREMDQGDFRIFWTGDEPAVGQAALDAVTNALPAMGSIFSTDLIAPLNVYVYPTAADLRAGLRLTGRDWIGAHAHPELGVILVSAAGSLTAAADLAQSIPHELAHLFLYRATGTGYESTPLWFDEGLASSFESAPNPNYATRLDEATAAGETLAFADLCYAFPSADEQALLAYAQSVSLVRFIQSEYGNQALQQMIQELADGADCHSVSERALGISLASLNQDWLDQEAPQSPMMRLWRNGRGWLAIIAAGFLLVGLLAGLPKGKKR